MKTRNYWLLAAGVICLLTSAIHLIFGQIDLIDPIMTSQIDKQIKAEMLGLWHLVTAFLVISSVVLIKGGVDYKHNNKSMFLLLAALHGFGSLAFVFASIYTSTFAPQWILLLPICLLIYVGVKNLTHSTNR